MPKLNERLLGLWAEILVQTPGSRLLLKNAALNDNALKQELVDFFAARGVAPGRVEPLGFIPSLASHLEAYNQVDIALDSFPYNGTTTTCEALWMGVPVLTLVGVAHRSRVGLSLLSSLGLGCLAAPDAQSYKTLAVELATQPARLDALRRSLRGTMAGSPLCDCAGLTAKLERAYRGALRIRSRS